MRVLVFLEKMFVAMIVMIAFLLPGMEAGAADFPQKPIQVLVGWPAGSTNDLMDRAVAQALQKILKQPVIIQNVPGAGGALVLGRVKTEAPDGYTLFQTGSTMFSQTPHTRTTPYDPLKDFAYLAQHARFVHLISDRPPNPWTNFEELIQYVKKNPKKVKYATAGVGNGNHVMMEYLAQSMTPPKNAKIGRNVIVSAAPASFGHVSDTFRSDHILQGHALGKYARDDPGAQEEVIVFPQVRADTDRDRLLAGPAVHERHAGSSGMI